jgi:aminoglycoside phosphotransferase (APT) family kinase protein
MIGETGSISDKTIRDMVEVIEPRWRVKAIERADYGTDLVAILRVTAPGGPYRAVLKATTADLVAPVMARAEPRFLELVGEKTSISVPTVYGYHDDHPDLPAPFFLMSFEEGENFEGRSDQLNREARQTVLREAGKNLAELHDLGPLSAYGSVGVEEGELAVLDSEANPQYDDFRDKLLVSVDDTLDSLTQGGFFLELADDPERFADLVPPLRKHLQKTIPELPEPDPPTYDYWDYRYGNLLLDPEIGELQAALDWANIGADDPAYNLAKVESNLLTPERDSATRTAALRQIFRTAYTESRNSWTFNEATQERMEVYRLTDRLDSMACLPLWYEEEPPEKRDERAAEHRAFISQYI